MNEIDSIIGQLERQKAAIENAIGALRGVSGITNTAPAAKEQDRPAKAAKKRRGKRRLTAEGRQRLSENMRKRWAAKRSGSVARKKRTKRGYTR